MLNTDPVINKSDFFSCQPIDKKLKQSSNLTLKTGTEIIAELKNKDLEKKKILNLLTFTMSSALGTFSALALSGVMINPIGWAIAGGGLLITLMGIKYYGDEVELQENFLISLAGFVAGNSLVDSGIAVANGDSLRVIYELILLGTSFTMAVILFIWSFEEHLSNQQKLGLGMSGIILSDEHLLLKNERKIDFKNAILITSISEHSPSQKPAVQVGDIVISCDGEKINDLSTFSNKLMRQPDTASINIKLLRNNDLIELQLYNKGWTLNNNDFGIAATSIKNEIVVTGINHASPLYEADIRVGDCLKKVNGTDIKNFNSKILETELSRCRKQREVCQIELIRNGSHMTVSVLPS